MHWRISSAYLSANMWRHIIILASITCLGEDIYPLQTETSTLTLGDVKILTIQKMGGLVSFPEIHFCHTHQGKLKN